MLISRVQADVHAVEFAAKNATALIPSSDKSGFADYLARVMDAENYSAERPRDPEPNPPEQFVSYNSQDASQPQAETIHGSEVAEREVKTADQTPPDAETRTAESAQDKADTKARVADDSGEAKRKEIADKENTAAELEGSTKAAADDAAAQTGPTEKSVKTVDTGAPDVWKSHAVSGESSPTVKASEKNQMNELPLKQTQGSGEAFALSKTKNGVDPESPSAAEESGLKITVVEKKADQVTLDVVLPEGDETAELASDRLVEGREKKADTNTTRLAGKASDVTSLTATAQREIPKSSSGNEQRETRLKSSRDARIEVSDLRAAKDAAREIGAEQASSGRSGSEGQDSGTNGKGGFADNAGGRSGMPESSPQQVAFGQRGESFAARIQGGQSTGQQLGTQLGRSLQEGLGSEIVRHARFVIRNNDSGSIRLNLRPEQLGNVRISLQMQDGHIAGRIIVDNQTVREAFEQNLQALERAFHEAGLEMGQIDVSLADSEAQSEQAGDHGGHRRGPARAVEALAGAVPEVNWIDDAHELVDVTV